MCGGKIVFILYFYKIFTFQKLCYTLNTLMFDMIITDSGIPNEYREYFAENNIPMIICKDPVSEAVS